MDLKNFFFYLAENQLYGKEIKIYIWGYKIQIQLDEHLFLYVYKEKDYYDLLINDQRILKLTEDNVKDLISKSSKGEDIIESAKKLKYSIVPVHTILRNGKYSLKSFKGDDIDE